MDNSISDMFSISDIIFDTSNVTLNNDFENLRIIFEEVLYNVSFVDVEENVFKDEIPKLKQACIEVLHKIHEHLKNLKSNLELLEEIKVLLKRYINLLNFAHGTVKYITNKIPFCQAQSLPLAISEILLQAFKHCKESDNLYGNHFVALSYMLTDLFKKANELQSSFFVFLNDILIFDLNEEEQVICLVQVTNILAAIGEVVSNLDIKTTAELWKAYLVLLKKYNDSLKTRISIESPVKYLCTEIIESVESVGTMLDMRNVEKSLKISSFNLKIVIKLCGLYDVYGETIEKLFDLLIILNRYSIPYLQFLKRDPKLIDLMQIYVIVASEPLLNCLIDNRTFVEHYFKSIKNLFQDEDRRLAAIFFTISIIKKILNSDLEVQRQWNSDDTTYNIFCVVFSFLDQFHAEFSLDYPIQTQSLNGQPTRISSLYEYILIHLTSLIISVTPKQFKIIQNVLFISIMQTNLWKAMIASDIWIAMGRYGSAEFCFDSLIFLINVFLKLQNFTRPETKYLGNLIQRNYCILSNKYRVELLNRYSWNKFLKLWTAIGINNEPSLVCNLKNIMDEATENIDLFLENKNLELFQYCCELLDFLSSYSFIELTDLKIKNFTSRLLKLWSLNIDSRIQNQPWILKFVTTLSKITSCLISHFNGEELLKVLQSLRHLNNEKLSKCLILKSLATKQIPNSQEQNEILDTISNLFNTLLKEKNPVIKQQILETFSYFAYQTPHEHILANVVEGDTRMQEEISNYLQKIIPDTTSSQIDYFRAQGKVSFQHKCYENLNFIEPQQKKKKLDLDVNVIGILQTLKHNCDCLINYYKSETMPDNVVAELSVIESKLKCLLKN